MKNTVRLRSLRVDPRRTLERLCESDVSIVPISGVRPYAGVVTDPEIVRIVLGDSGSRFQKGPGTLRLRFALGDGTATSSKPADGNRYYGRFQSAEEFRRARREALLPAFDPKVVSGHFHSMQRLCCEQVRAWDATGACDVYLEALNFMTRSLIVHLFRRDAEAKVEELARYIWDSDRQVDKRLRSPLSWRRSVFDRGQLAGRSKFAIPPTKSSNFMSERRARVFDAARAVLSSPSKARAADPISLLGQLFEAEPNDDELFQTNVVTLIFAGYENTASAAGWLLWSLARHAEWQERVQTEIAKNQGMDHFDVHAFPQLKACIDETLRLYPPVWSTAREAIQDTSVGNYELPAGSILVLSPWLQQRRVASWPDPERFRPERFMGSRPSLGEYFPFGLGPRTCVGRIFATTELAAYVSTVLANWQLSVPEGQAEPVPWFCTNQRPAAGIHLDVTPRRG